ncbi:alpha/beta hydrolase [Sabulicella glaciei]|uniref:Lysophospholipase n=1 Tax=Sabulicella glaciei TaxID=2984948 RepID=A0ABT3NTU7_9PROT|nr:alpha/beta fold hydrolase [Roseococcus sp. MDT2-1-1]MCW8085589.1 lysophospholipase [Roseococcus sp. MDT2-1-1]
MWLAYSALILASFYAALLGGMYLAQTGLIFPTALARIERVQLPGSAQHLEIRMPDGAILSGVKLPGTKGTTNERTPRLLGFGGNAWNAEAMALYLHNLFPGQETVAVHYRGYASSSGRPSADALLSDSTLIFDHLQQQDRERPVIAIGFSLGASVAAYLAKRRPVAGLILVTPFDSLEALAQDLYWWAPVGLLLRHRMPTVEFLRGSPVPTALILAGQDRVVPARRSAALRPVIDNLVFEAIIAAGHNDLYGHADFAPAMHEALARIGAAATAARSPPGASASDW